MNNKNVLPPSVEKSPANSNDAAFSRAETSAVLGEKLALDASLIRHLCRLKSDDLLHVRDLFYTIAESLDALAHARSMMERAGASTRAYRKKVDRISADVRSGRPADVTGMSQTLLDVVMRKERRRIRDNEKARRGRRACQLAAQGKTNKEIAPMIGVQHPKSVARIIREYRNSLAAGDQVTGQVDNKGPESRYA